MYSRLGSWQCSRTVLIGLGLLSFFSTGFAADDSDDGPGRGVARISLINGDVSIRRGDSGDCIAAALNSPLVVQDRVLTGVNSRTEIQFDWANMVRLSSNSEVRLAELEYRRYILQIAHGTVAFRILRDIDADVELSTPSVAVRPFKKGTYRISVFEDGTSEITVRSGEAEIYTPRGSERLQSGRTMFARGTAADPEYRIGSEIREDDWDRWNRDRDRDLERTSSYRYVSPDVFGAEDLDHHGSWVHVHDHGWLWSPRVAVGWAPYRYGRWSWVDWNGWTWISHDPWGWAPYHYGRWLYRAPYGWCWSPGVIHRRHYWSPALVAFVGFGRGVGVGVGWGQVGWIPLAPRDRLNRWWGSRYYSNNRNNFYTDNSINIVRNVNITNIYQNARFRDSITVVDHDGFARGRSGGAFRGTDSDFTQANLVQGRMPIVPGRESLRLANREASPQVVSRSADRFYGRRSVAAVERVPFEEQRRGLEQVARRTFGTDNPASTRTAAVSAETDGRGWRRVEPAPGNPERGAAPTEWRRFGTPRGAEGTNAAEEQRGERGGRFGEPATVRSFTAQVPDSPSGGTPDRGGRISSEVSAEPRGAGGEWRRFGDSNGGSNRAGGSDEGNGRGSRETAERSAARSEAARRSGSSDAGERSPADRGDRMSMRSSERSDRGGGNGNAERQSDRGGRVFGSGDPVRISPPMVRDRGDRGAGGDAGGATRSAPPSISGGGDGGSRGGARGGDAGSRGDGGGVSRGDRGAMSGATGGGGRGGRGR